jgi:hypothetical protein
MDVPGPQRVSPDESHITHWFPDSEITDSWQSCGQVSHHSSSSQIPLPHEHKTSQGPFTWTS